MREIPVITIDGPSGTGKGTLSLRLAEALGWHWLDSGAIYRAVAWAVDHHEVQLADPEGVKQLLSEVDIQIEARFDQPARVLCDGKEITRLIRTEACGMLASQVSRLPEVRQAVLSYQRAFRQEPGLVTDGRDMGTVVFPDAELKIYLEASPAERAKRRQLQLQAQGINVSLQQVQDDLSARDDRDQNRDISPAKPALDAKVIDTTELSVDQVFAAVMTYAQSIA